MDHENSQDIAYEMEHKSCIIGDSHIESYEVNKEGLESKAFTVFVKDINIFSQHNSRCYNLFKNKR